MSHVDFFLPHSSQTCRGGGQRKYWLYRFAWASFIWMCHQLLLWLWEGGWEKAHVKTQCSLFILLSITGRHLPRSLRFWRGIWVISWFLRMRFWGTSVIWRLSLTYRRAWSGSPPASGASSATCPRALVSVCSCVWLEACPVKVCHKVLWVQRFSNFFFFPLS